jgi:hypothetical protein
MVISKIINKILDTSIKYLMELYAIKIISQDNQ